MTRVTLKRLVIILFPTALIGVFIWNPFNYPSWNPFARLSGFQLFRNPTSAMEPTIVRGSMMVANSWPYVLDEPKRGDLVVFRFPPNPSILYVKRIIAGGDSTVSVSENCLATVDGRLLDEPFVRSTGEESAARCRFEEVLIPKEHFFVLSDNRAIGSDSRAWGFLPRKNIVARVNAK